MPTYDYECDACGHQFELFQGITEEPKRKCPECGKLKLRRLFGTGAAIVFKGSGFYQTDYRSESYKKAAEADSKAARPESKGDSKGAAGDSKGDAKGGKKDESKGSESGKKKKKKD